MLTGSSPAAVYEAHGEAAGVRRLASSLQPSSAKRRVEEMVRVGGAGGFVIGVPQPRPQPGLLAAAQTGDFPPQDPKVVQEEVGRIEAPGRAVDPAGALTCAAAVADEAGLVDAHAFSFLPLLVRRAHGWSGDSDRLLDPPRECGGSRRGCNPQGKTHASVC